MLLTVSKRWYALPQVSFVPEDTSSVRSLTSILDVGREVPFYLLLKEKLETGAAFLDDEEIDWLQTLVATFDRYMSRVIQASHFELWDSEINLRAEYRDTYKTYPGTVKDSNELPIMVIVARMLMYNELMREVTFLKQSENSRMINGMDFDLYLVPPMKEVPIWTAKRAVTQDFTPQLDKAVEDLGYTRYNGLKGIGCL